MLSILIKFEYVLSTVGLVLVFHKPSPTTLLNPTNKIKPLLPLPFSLYTLTFSCLLL